MSQETWQVSFEQFRQAVLQDLALQQRLRETQDQAMFVSLLVRLGHEHGYDFTAEDVEQALRESRRAWIERWLDT